jgi:hypothetical protein
MGVCVFDLEGFAGWVVIIEGRTRRERRGGKGGDRREWRW